MTFAEYNTDKNFDDKKSSLEELVKIGLKEGKTSDEIKSSLSPKWQKSKKIGQFDDYVTMYSTPKEEPKKEEVKETAPKVLETPKEETKIKASDKSHLETTNAIAEEAENNELARQKELSEDAWNKTYSNMSKQGEAFGQIDDRLVAQLPTFMVKRYADGEFGDPKSSDAKLRLTHFIVNGLQSKLKNASNAAMIAAGRSPMFSDTTSDYEKYQQTNLAQGMENRWNKYKQETQAAIDLAKNRGMKEEDIDNTIRTISSNGRLQTAFNMMNDKQKLNLMNITKEIGDKIGNFSNPELMNFLVGAAVSGDDVDAKEMAAIAVAKFGPDAIAAVQNGNIKDGIASLLGGGGVDAVAGVGGAGGSSGDTGTTLEDGTKVDPGKIMSNDDYNQLAAAANDLSQQYYDGKISEEKFRSEYGKLENLMSQHKVYGAYKNIKSADDVIRTNNVNRLEGLDEQFNAINADAKAGKLSPEAYQKKIATLRASAEKWGADEKMLKSIDKQTFSNKEILKAVEKASKKKK